MDQEIRERYFKNRKWVSEYTIETMGAYKQQFINHYKMMMDCGVRICASHDYLGKIANDGEDFRFKHKEFSENFILDIIKFDPPVIFVLDYKNFGADLWCKILSTPEKDGGPNWPGLVFYCPFRSFTEHELVKICTANPRLLNKDCLLREYPILKQLRDKIKS